MINRWTGSSNGRNVQFLYEVFLIIRKKQDIKDIQTGNQQNLVINRKPAKFGKFIKSTDDVRDQVNKTKLPKTSKDVEQEIGIFQT